jgi:excisionase family DNA binding protein
MAHVPEILWTVTELSTVTEIAKPTIYDWVHEGYVPHVKVGGCVRFRPSEVQAWLDRHAKPGRPRRVPEVQV